MGQKKSEILLPSVVSPAQKISVFHTSRCMQQVASLQQFCFHLCADTHRRICRVPRVVMLATGTVELDSCSSWYNNTVQSDMASKLFWPLLGRQPFWTPDRTWNYSDFSWLCSTLSRQFQDTGLSTVDNLSTRFALRLIQNISYSPNRRTYAAGKKCTARAC